MILHPIRISKLYRMAAICCILLSSHHGFADVKEDLLKGVFAEGVNVDLRDPSYCDKVITTTQGGVITGPGIRIQARHIVYTRKVVDGIPILTIEAEGDLMLEFGDYVFIGERLEYDFQSQSGTLYCGRTSLEPWFIGGEIIHLFSDFSFNLNNAFVTTSEGFDSDWMLEAEYATLREDRYLHVENVRFQILNFPLFRLPLLNLDLETLGEHPINYTVGWGGRQGPRVGMSYQFLSTKNWNLFARLDYHLRRGPGGGIEANYRSDDRKETFETINYIARDVSVFNRSERTRFRFQGNYNNLLWDDRFSINLTYDKLSDEDMAADYDDQNLELEPSERTQLEIRRQEDRWIATFFARVRLNYFETVKQELPSVFASWKPFNLGDTGIISENYVDASYLNFKYAHGMPNIHDFSSTRLELSHRSYRPFTIGFLNITPEAGGVTIFYGDSPQNDPKCVAVGMLACEFKAPMHKYFEESKHILTPYARYEYFSYPTTPPKDHYIFDIDDGWFRLNMVRFGFDQSYYFKSDNGVMHRFLYADLYANAFINVHTIPQSVPKVYLRTILYPSPTLRHTVCTAWDLEEKQLDHINFHTLWTINPDAAVSFEFRHRSAYDWRKVDRYNFMLDAYRSIDQLLHSPLSDRRDTALLHFFYRYHPNWAIECEALTGWNRKDHSRYTEFEVDLLGSLRSACQVKISYQHRTNDNRVAIYFSMGAVSADRLRVNDLVPTLPF